MTKTKNSASLADQTAGTTSSSQSIDPKAFPMPGSSFVGDGFAAICTILHYRRTDLWNKIQHANKDFHRMAVTAMKLAAIVKKAEKKNNRS